MPNKTLLCLTTIYVAQNYNLSLKTHGKEMLAKMSTGKSTNKNKTNSTNIKIM